MTLVPILRLLINRWIYSFSQSFKFEVYVLEAGQDISENQISVFNLLGQKVEIKIGKIESRKIDFDLTGNVPGVYFSFQQEMKLFHIKSHLFPGKSLIIQITLATISRYRHLDLKSTSNFGSKYFKNKMNG
jgi:hypothetical protein